MYVYVGTVLPYDTREEPTSGQNHFAVGQRIYLESLFEMNLFCRK